MVLQTEDKAEIIEQYQMHEKDTGSPEVQIAILTRRIQDLQAKRSDVARGPIL